MKAKRIVSILLTGSMLLSLLPVSALAAAPVFDAPAQTTAKKAAPLVQEADASRSTEEEAATRSSRNLDAENGTADSITIQLNADGTPADSGDDGIWYYDPSSGGRLYLYNGGFTLKPSSESGAESALQGVELIINQDADFADGTVGCWTNNNGIISGGTFQGNVNNDKTISDGTFQGNVNNNKTISDGTFKGEVFNYGTISDGTFKGEVYNHDTISGGTFQGGEVYNVRGAISGGIFKKAVGVYASGGNATIEGGTFEKSMTLMNDDASITISDGLFDGEVFTGICRFPLSISGGLFTKAVDVSHVNNPTDLSITGGYFVSEPTVPNGSDIAFTSVSDQNGGNFQVPVNDDWSENGYNELYVPSGSSEQPNTITVKTDTALIDCLADGVSIMDNVRTNADGSYAIDVYSPAPIVLVTEEPAPPTPPTPGEPGGELDPEFSSGAAALGIVLGTAGLGYVTYIYGSSLYLHYALPGGFIPSTRQELATVLWTTAGKPDPVSTALYTDIPADNIEQQKAARWCAEQGLLSDHGATFGPDTKVTNARIIRAWNSLKKVPVPIK
jgi:cytoskeletal protein CcmA (bactofilin family)